MRTFRKAAIAGVAVLALALSACAGQASKDKEKQDEAKKKVGEYSMTQASASDINSSPLIKKIKKRGKIIVGVKVDQPLIGNKQGDTYSGFDIEQARLLSTRIFGDKKNPDKHLEFVEATSQNRDSYLSSGKVDMIIASYSIYPSRLKTTGFAGPYFYAGQNVLINADQASKIKTVKDLAGKKVCIAAGSGSNDGMKKKNPKAVIKNLQDYGACAKAVADGTYPAMSTDDSILAGYASVYKDKVKLLGNDQVFTDEPYGIAVKKSDKKAVDFINGMIKESYKNGDWDKAFKLTFATGGMKMPTGKFYHPEIGKFNLRGTNVNK